jgi:hypothetical protein
MLAEVAQAAGMKVDVPAKDAAEPPAEFRQHWPPFTADPIVAYTGDYESDCGHHPGVYFEAKQPFPRCEACGRRVQWRRVDI